MEHPFGLMQWKLSGSYESDRNAHKMEQIDLEAAIIYNQERIPGVD